MVSESYERFGCGRFGVLTFRFGDVLTVTSTIVPSGVNLGCMVRSLERVLKLPRKILDGLVDVLVLDLTRRMTHDPFKRKMTRNGEPGMSF